MENLFESNKVTMSLAEFLALRDGNNKLQLFIEKLEELKEADGSLLGYKVIEVIENVLDVKEN